MRNFLLVFFAAGALLINGCSSTLDNVRECYSLTQFKRLSSPAFDDYLINVRGNAKSRIDIYTQLQYKYLRFKKEGERYRASYTLRTILRDSLNEIVRTVESDRTISVRTYEESLSPRTDSYLQSLTVEPGRYTLEIESIDDLSRLRSRVRRDVIAADHTVMPFSASTPLFLDTLITDERGVTLRPILPVNVSALTDSVGVFQEIYQLQPLDTLRIEQRFFSARSRAADADDLPFMFPPYRSAIGQCATVLDSLVFRSDSTLTVTSAATLQLMQFYPLPGVGHTAMERNIILFRRGTADTIRASQDLFRRERRLLNSVSLEEELSLMRYLVREYEYDSLKHSSAAEMNRRINKFWEERGGAERRREFIQRAVDANKLFSGCQDGLRTPMGIIYVICGIPAGIDCLGDFVENWYYAIGERSYPVQFRAVGTTHRMFELQPFSVSDVLWQYSIDQWRRKR